MNETSAREQADAITKSWLKTTSGLHRAALHTHISVPALTKSITAALEAKDRESTGLARTVTALEADRDMLRSEVERLRAGGCARDQRTTQYCAEAVSIQQERDEARRLLREAVSLLGKVYSFNGAGSVARAESLKRDVARALGEVGK